MHLDYARGKDYFLFQKRDLCRGPNLMLAYALYLGRMQSGVV